MEDAYKEASDYEKSVKEEDFEFHDLMNGVNKSLWQIYRN